MKNVYVYRDSRRKDKYIGKKKKKNNHSVHFRVYTYYLVSAHRKIHEMF